MNYYNMSLQRELYGRRYVLSNNIRYRNRKIRRDYALIIRKRFILAILTALLLTLGICLGSSMLSSSQVQAQSIQQNFKYYTSIQVEPGDTLWSIAGKYLSSDYSNREEYMRELAAVNNLSETTIHAGQYLTIPYYSKDIK